MPRKLRLSFKALFSAFLLCAAENCVAADLPEGLSMSDIVRVEEDWLVYVKNPDPDADSPQIVNVITPTGSTDGIFGLVELNHSSAPSFRGGGHQIQSWQGEHSVTQLVTQENALLSRDYDKVEYTVAMELDGEFINFELRNGKSRTWGHFAKQGIVAPVARGEIDMTNYDPQMSVDNTTINVGAHRVEVMYQTAVRYYSVRGLEHTDDTNRVIHRYQSVVQYCSLEEYESNPQYYNMEITE